MRLWPSHSKNEKGTILMEAVICLPVLLLVSLGVAQFAHIWLCRTMVQYAAYCGARATLTAPRTQELSWARRAAEVVCAPIAFMNPDSSDDDNDFIFPGITLPNQGTGNVLAGSGCVKKQRTNHNQEVLSVYLLDYADSWEEDVASGQHTHTPSCPRLDTWHRGVQVTMKVPLLFPLAGPVIGKAMSLYSNGNFAPQRTIAADNDPVTTLDGDIFPRIKLREKVFIEKPFRTTWSN